VEKQDANFKYNVFHVLIRHKAMMCDQPFLVVRIRKYLLDVIKCKCTYMLQELHTGRDLITDELHIQQGVVIL